MLVACWRRQPWRFRGDQPVPQWHRFCLRVLLRYTLQPCYSVSSSVFSSRTILKLALRYSPPISASVAPKALISLLAFGESNAVLLVVISPTALPPPNGNRLALARVLRESSTESTTRSAVFALRHALPASSSLSPDDRAEARSPSSPIRFEARLVWAGHPVRHGQYVHQSPVASKGSWRRASRSTRLTAALSSLTYPSTSNAVKMCGTMSRQPSSR